MIINPVFILVVVYFLGNFYAFLNAIGKGGFEAYGYFYSATAWELVLVFVLQAISLFGLLIFFKINLRKYKHVQKSFKDGAGYLLFTLIMAFFAFSQYYGVGVAGSDFKFESANLLNYVFVLLQPDVWFFLIAPNLRSNKLFWICAAAFLVSLTARGWMGGVMLIGVVVLIRKYPVKLKIKNAILFLLIFLTLVAFLPLLDAFKWGMRAGMSVGDVFDLIANANYFELFPVVLQSVVDRFQNFNYVVYAFQDKVNLFDNIVEGNINWFFQGGILNSVYCKMASCGKDIGIYLAEGVSGQSNLSWNVDVGIVGWMVILGWGGFVYVIFSVLLLVIGYRIFGSKFGLKGVMVFGAFSLIYYFHGWNNAFFNLIIYAFLCQFLIRLQFKKFAVENCKSQ